MKTLLAIGDLKDFEAYKKFIKQKKYFFKSNLLLRYLTYTNLEKGRIPNIPTKHLIIFPFFPFNYWDKKIEPKNYKGVYGNQQFYTKFNKFWKHFENKIKTQFPDKKITYINHPKHLVNDRDKELTKRKVKKLKVKVPKSYFTRNIKTIIKLLNKGKKIYIKVRYGSMGKGITYLEKDKWFTNFEFKRGKIISRKSDYGWAFKDITNNEPFLRSLLQQDIIIEDAIEPLLIKQKKFDMRLYIYKKKVIYTYCRTNNSSAITTNISQGAVGEPNRFLKHLPDKQFKLAKKLAIRSLEALKIKFAGVDIMFNSNKEPLFMEMNAFPGFPRARRFNLSKLLIHEIIKDYSK